MDIERAKELLKSLAEGIDPLTGEVLPKDHVCNQSEMIRALYCVLGELDGAKTKPAKAQPENAGKHGRRTMMPTFVRCLMTERQGVGCVNTSSAPEGR